MKKVVLIPDSFKGTVSSTELCGIMKRQIQEHFPNCEVVSIPVADGGEGSVDAFLTALGGNKITVTVENPYFEPMEAFYGIIDNGSCAVIEMAACAGLPLVENRKNPLLTTTYGVGKLIVHAAQSGVKKIIVGLGGSATNDAGCGAAAAAGIKFYNKNGESFIPTGGSLKDVAKIDTKDLHPSLNGVEIITMCDIDNPMYGKSGAAYVFAPQKGADAAMVESLDAGLLHLCEVIDKCIGTDLSQIPGGGAAGAMGAGMVAFFSSRLQMGIETVLDTVNFDSLITDTDVIITGEGKLDTQSLRGKVVIGVARRAKAQSKPVIAIVGGADYGIDDAYDMGLTAVFPINRLPQDFEIIRAYSKENVKFTIDNVVRLIKFL